MLRTWTLWDFLRRNLSRLDLTYRQLILSKVPCWEDTLRLSFVDFDQPSFTPSMSGAPKISSSLQPLPIYLKLH